jgi:3',5'-cyclic AMP phosphodiesterase CpdA
MLSEVNVAAVPGDAHEQLTFWIDTHAADFVPMLDEFISDLARMLNIETSQLRVLSVVDGCCKLTLDLPRETYNQAMQELLEDATEPEWLVFKQKWRIVYVYDARKKGKSANIKLPVLVEKWSSGRTLTWLHLSDIHWKHESKSASLMQEDTLGKLLKQLPDLLHYWKLYPDIAFVTGDISHSGQPKEYELAFTFFENLRNGLPAAAPMYFIPGNHDSDSARVNPAFDEKFSRMLNASNNPDEYQEILASYLLDDKSEDDRSLGFAPLSAFFEFTRTAVKLGQPEQNHDYFFTTLLAKNDVRLGIAGFNSAWRCASKLDHTTKDYGRLALGLPQIKTALEDIGQQETDATVALVHHPPDSEWYSYFDRFLHRAELSNFDFVLRGHEHVDDNVQIGYLDKGDSMVMGAGALYDGGGYPKTFKAFRFNLDSSLFQVYFWRYSNEKRSWLPDPGPQWKLGYLQAQLGPRMRKRHPATEVSRIGARSAQRGLSGKPTRHKESARPMLAR